MSVTLTDSFAIIDDFLESQEAEYVWRYIQDEKFEMVHQRQWVKAFRLSDGAPAWGPPFISDNYPDNTQCQVYPTGRGIDLVIGKLKQTVSDYQSLIGAFGKDWAYFFARAYLYPQGCGLSWHRDNENNATGAFVYYAHPEWDPQWGGEFLVGPAETKYAKLPKEQLYEKSEKFLGSHLDNKFECETLLKSGIGQYILPKPNRLVLLTSGVIHCIKKVDPAAGNKVRATIQGFFQDPTGVLKKNAA